MTAILARNRWLALSLMCAWIVSIGTARAQSDQSNKKAGGGDTKAAKSTKSAAKDDESKGMAGMSGMSGMT